MANFVDYKHLPACTLYIHMKLSIVARLHVLHAHGCVSEQLHSVLSSASLSSALLLLLEVVNATLPPTLFLNTLS